MLASAARLLDGTPLCASEAINDMAAHALDQYPEESIGYLDRGGRYVALENVSPDPLLFALPRASSIAAAMHRGDFRALCHSHPGGPDCPSEADMRAQHEMAAPFVIVSTNGQACAPAFAWGDELLDDEPLVGRQFRHGVRDCYALVRVWWFRRTGERLPDYPRNWEWWLDPTPGEKDLYRRYFADAGFREIDRDEARPGDCWLAAIRSDVPNHAGVYLDEGLALHHPSSGLANDPMRLSKRESIARWTPWITHWVRRD